VEFPRGRQQIVEFLRRTWSSEQDYRLIRSTIRASPNRSAAFAGPSAAGLTPTRA